MTSVYCVLIVSLAVILTEANVRALRRDNERVPVNYDSEIYTASWVVEITEGGKQIADSIADQFGFKNLGRLKIGGQRELYHFELGESEQLTMKTDSPYISKSDDLFSQVNVGFVEQQIIRPRVKKSYIAPTDPLFDTQWNLLNTGQWGDEFSGNDLNVEPAWLQGVTGCNVTAVVVDDGLDFPHEDLWDNFAPLVSYNFRDNSGDPSTGFPWHGTSCGGIIGAVKNDVCGVGIAYEVNLGGVALLGANTDLNEANSLTFENDIVDVYSNSWGPSDSGSHVAGPGQLTRLALQMGADYGRGGKGSIYTWANGNGGFYDDCAADGYTQSIYTISVGAIGVDGNPSPFDEECSAKIVTTYVTNPSGQSSITTTALNGECTLSFGGTSAATPMASGIIALTLEANPDLTWRDVQYLIVYTSNTELTNTANSITNGAGLLVSRQFGFGVMDAEAMVTRARHWINVPPQLEENFTPSVTNGNVDFVTPFTSTLTNDGSMILYVEHVIVAMTMNATSGDRGDLRVELTSPSGTVSILLGHRDRDYGTRGYSDWQFMSVMFWGEDPTGEWTLNVTSRSPFTEASVSDVSFQIYGVSSIPESVASIPDECHPECRRGCAQVGSEFCDACVNLRNAYTFECIDTCPPGYTERNGYCYDPTLPSPECNSPLKQKEGGSCADAGFTECCTGDNCEVFAPVLPVSCYCDAACHVYGDCCDDIINIGCYQQNVTNVGTVIPYIICGDTPGVMEQYVPVALDGISSPIFVQFPFGSHIETTVYVGTNGYFTFATFTGYQPFLFYDNTTVPLVAPFFADIDIRQGGQICYEIHTEANSLSILSQVNLVINDHAETDFYGEWMLVATWDNVPPYGSDNTTTNTFQGVIVTDFERSFAVFIYYCGDLSFSNGATIGFATTDGLFANHPASLRGSAQAIACFNSPASPWVNVVYEISIPVVTGFPYISLGETFGVATQSVPAVDDGVSSPISVQFPFGSEIESTVYVGTNGYFTFDGFTGFSPFTFIENTTQSLVAPFFTDIDISPGVGQINYEIHTPATSQAILSQVNSLISNYAQIQFDGVWLLVATWDGVPHISATSITSTFQGILITDYSRSYAVFTYYCGDLNYSFGASIGFAAPGGLFANHPAALYGSAQSIACLNSPASPWVNVVYEITSQVCDEGYFYSFVVNECIPLDLPYIYPPTIVDGCDPERNEEYRMNIQAETDALINEYFNVLSEDD